MESIKSFDFLYCGESGSVAEQIQKIFEKECIYPHFRQIRDEKEFDKAMQEKSWNLIFFDYEESKIPLEYIVSERDKYDKFLPVLIYSVGLDSLKSAEVIRCGANNYLTKDDLQRLIKTTLDELRLAQSKKTNLRYQSIREHLKRYDLIKRITGNISHKINNMLMVVLNNAAFLLEDKGLLPHMQDDVHQLIQVARTGQDYVKKLLGVAGGAVLNSKIIELNSFLHRLAENLRPIAGMNIHINTGRSQSPCEIKVDDTLLTEAFKEIVKFSKSLMVDGGEINIQAEIVSFEEDDEFLKASGLKKGEYVKFTLSDSGKPLDEEQAQHLFEPYLFNTGDEKSGNLGLSISYGIIWEHNGIIDFESIEGKGNFYYIYIPIFKRDSKEIPLPRISQYAITSKGTILIVEDDENVKNILIRIFFEEGYNVLDALDGLGALVMLQRSKPPDLIALVTDVIMPKMGGLELARTLREKYKDLKVIFISGYPDNDGEILRFENSIFIQKPIAKEVLMQKVKSFLFEDQKEE